MQFIFEFRTASEIYFYISGSHFLNDDDDEEEEEEEEEDIIIIIIISLLELLMTCVLAWY